MMEHNYQSLKEVKLYVTVLTIVLVIFFFLPAVSWSRSKRLNGGNHLQGGQPYDEQVRKGHRGGLNIPDKHWFYEPLHKRGSNTLLSKNDNKRYNRLSPEEKTMLEKRYQEWESLSEQEQKMLRRRMQKYNRLRPQERERFQQRYRQLKKLPPDERYNIRKKLQKWDNLSPDEKEQIRQRFRRP